MDSGDSAQLHIPGQYQTNYRQTEQIDADHSK